MNIECRKVQALMSLYIDDALSYNLKMFVYNHLQECRPCMKKYLELKKSIQFVKSNLYKTGNAIADEPIFDVIKYENFKKDSSAYLDNELDDTETKEFKEYLHSMTVAREYFNTSIKVNNHTKNFIKYQSPVLKHDLSKKIIKTVKLKKITDKICFKEIFFSFLFASFICVSIYSIENSVLKHKIFKQYEKITMSKIKDNIIRLHLKEFLY